MKKIKYILCCALVGMIVFMFSGCTNNVVKKNWQPTPTGLAVAEKRDRQAPQGDIFVSTIGDDNSNGSEVTPVKSLERALEIARSIEKDKKVICFKEGEYNIKPITLTSEDDGIVFYGENNVRLNGGFELNWSDFVDYNGKIKKLDLSKYGITAEDIGNVRAFGQYNTAVKYDEDGCLYSELFVGDKRMTLARYPNVGEKNLRTGKVVDNGDTRDIYKNGKTTINPDWDTMKNPRGGKFKVSKKIINRMKTWKNSNDIWMFGYFYYDWADSTTPVKSFDSNSITTKYASPYGFKKNAEFYFFNVFEELDVENEWYIDKNSMTLYFIPPKDCKNQTVSLSLAKDALFTLDGAKNVVFDGITMCGSRSSGIKGEGDNITIKNCTIKNVAENAVELNGNDILVECNTMTAMGKGGVILTGGDRQTLTSSNNMITNNLIYDWSQVYKTYQPAIGMHGVGMTASHNEIYESPHEAIAYTGNNHVIEYNNIHDVVKLSSDAAAIYSGRSWSNYGTVIRNNAIYNIGSGDFKPTAIYFDDGLSGQTAYGNLLVNIPSCGVLIGGGRDVNFYNNLIVNSGTPIQYDARCIEGVEKDTWFVHAKKGNTLWKTLEEVDIHSEIWKNAYPTLAEISYDFNNIKDSKFPANPSNSKVNDNVIVGAKQNIGSITKRVYNYSSIKNNTLFKLKENVFVGGGNYNLNRSVANFETLQFSQMGRLYKYLWWILIEMIF